jgi:hypothetical protein
MSEVKSVEHLSSDTVAEMKDRVKMLGSSISLLTNFIADEQRMQTANWERKVQAMKTMRDIYADRLNSVKALLQSHGSGMGFVYTDKDGTRHEFW